MGQVVISPNIRKTSERIDAKGNIINPRTKEVIKPVETEPVIPVVLPTPEIKPEVKTDALGDRIQKMIDEKVNKIVEQKIEEALKKLI